MSRRDDLSRVAIVGTSCAGKSTLARELSRRLGAPHVELDALYWGPNWTARSAEEFWASVAEATAGPAWLIDGNYIATRALVLQRATTVIWLNYPLRTLLRRATSRTFRRLATRECLFNGNREPLLGFLHAYWVPWQALQSYRPLRREYGALLASDELAHLHIVEIRSVQEAERFLCGIERPETSVETSDRSANGALFEEPSRVAPRFEEPGANC